MKRKLLLGTLITLLTLGISGGVAFAADSVQRHGGLGKVIAIGQNTLTVENQWGTFDILTDEKTVIRVPGVENPTLDDVPVGALVAGRVEKRDDSSFLAKAIFVVPPPKARLRGLGKVTAVGDNALTVETHRGETVDVLVDGETVLRIRGVENPTLEAIHVGDIVAGQVEKQEDGTLLAKVIAVVPPRNERIRGLGKVAEVQGDTLTIENRRGTFAVRTDEDTVFRVRGIENPTLEDIRVGDIVAGQAEKQGDGTLLAKIIAVVPPRPVDQP